MKFLSIAVALSVWNVEAFVPQTQNSPGNCRLVPLQATTVSESEELKIQKKKLFELIGTQSVADAVLADPITKEPIEIQTQGVILGDAPSRIQYKISSPSNKFEGSSDTFINLLEPVKEQVADNSSSQSPFSVLFRQALPYVPPPLRGPLASLTGDDEYMPMRDLFTSPAVSYAYERGWRAGFAQAGFPGADVEAEMAGDYFAPVVARSDYSVVVDMSCATGLFTRRFALADKYSRVLGCDYSDSMLKEARRRINAEPKLSKNVLKKTSLELVRLDVGQIPMLDESIDCLHAGAAMHCWPDLEAAASEIYRVLKPGGRYFATTFLSTYFAMLSNADGAAGSEPSQQAFQYFSSVDSLRDLLVRGGFEREKIQIEVLGSACVVIRAEK